MHLSLLSLICAATLVASTPAAAQDVRVLVEPGVHSIEAEDTVRPTLVNDSDATVYIARSSFDTRLERWDGEVWFELGPWYLLGGHWPAPVKVEPGQHRSLATLRIARERQARAEPGWYRITTLIYETEVVLAHEGPVRARPVVSEPFEVVE